MMRELAGVERSARSELGLASCDEKEKVSRAPVRMD